MDPSTLIIGTRRSALAMTQSRWVARRLESARPGLTVTLKEIVTTGDRVTDQALREMGGKGLFTKELENALLAGDVDLAVHSLKDLPAEVPDGLVLGGTPAREDPRDALATRGGARLQDLPAGAVIGTGSLRRRCQLRARFPDLETRDIRGNVDTRLSKVDAGDYAGCVLALAGLRRLGLEDRAAHVFSVEEVTPAPGQGALGLECRAGDTRVLGALALIHDSRAAICTEVERRVMALLGGGCSVPLGVHAAVTDDGAVAVSAFAGDPEGERFVRVERRGPSENADTLARDVASALEDGGAREFFAGADG